MAEKTDDAKMSELYEKIGKLTVSRAARLAMIDRQHKTLSIIEQCKIIGLDRSAIYYNPNQANEYYSMLMRMIDEQYMKTPFCGQRRMTVWLRRQGFTVNRKRVRRLMVLIGIKAIYQKPNTSKKSQENKIYPYLLRGLTIDRTNQV